VNIRDTLGARAKGLALILLATALAGLVMALPRFAQPPAYHQFADQRVCFTLPNCLNTLSNIFFVLAGVSGLRFIFSVSGRRAFPGPLAAFPYVLFFLAVILVGFGSAFYHLAPDNSRLIWDRAAIALALMAWLAAVVCERVGPVGLRLLPLFMIMGLSSVAYWGLSEAGGFGDLRPYALIQLVPVLFIPLLIWWYPPRYSGDRYPISAIGFYALAMLCDLGDERIFVLTAGVISGHTIKHLLAALAVYLLARYLQCRRICERLPARSE